MNDMNMRETASILVFVLFLMAAALVFFLPIYFAFTYNPFCLLLFSFSWLPALLIVRTGAALSDAIGEFQ